ncbi:MAG: hypothetical protein CMF63_02540 [Magnetovibrio sp.]|nr:hypothetical protein [Magnetovibrio sp.]
MLESRPPAEFPSLPAVARGLLVADETGLTLTVCHCPPGRSKWNKIEHRLFRHITQNWRGRPLTSRLSVVELIAATATTAGLDVKYELDTGIYVKGIKGHRCRDETHQTQR